LWIKELSYFNFSLGNGEVNIRRLLGSWNVQRTRCRRRRRLCHRGRCSSRISFFLIQEGWIVRKGFSRCTNDSSFEYGIMLVSIRSHVIYVLGPICRYRYAIIKFLKDFQDNEYTIYQATTLLLLLHLVVHCLSIKSYLPSINFLMVS
jgi:hypothetical protein